MQLHAFERRFELRLPIPFREYLGLASGMARSDTDPDLVHFWTLDEIVTHLSEPDSRAKYPFLPFADYSIECYVWALPIGPNGDVRDSVCT